MKNFPILFLVLLLLLPGCSSKDEPAEDDEPIIIVDDGVEVKAMELNKAFTQLNFNSPVDLQSPNDATNRLFVVEQGGIIRGFPNEPDVPATTVFLDLQNKVYNGAGEMGLLGMAFHPDYTSNGYFYIYYTPANNLSRISRFQVSSTDPNRAAMESELVLLEFSQPFTNHNGGQLAFGPDGYLYIASGDGGDAGDPMENAQDLSTLLGAILRIDVDDVQNSLNYAIPPDNPFIAVDAARAEIYAYGLRNPWRMSFDVQTGLLWTADVGQGIWEEIDIIEKGGNYGWDILEGNHCYASGSCDEMGLVPPVFEYNHDNDDRSVTGGYVYRGNEVAQLSGKYIYGDFVSGRIWALSKDPGAAAVNEFLMDTDLKIASFGTDSSNELYLCAFDGSIYKFEAN